VKSATRHDQIGDNLGACQKLCNFNKCKMELYSLRLVLDTASAFLVASVIIGVQLRRKLSFGRMANLLFRRVSRVIAMTKLGSAYMWARFAQALWHLVLACVPLLLSFTSVSLAQTMVRVGHFPNVTHAQALVAHALSRQGESWFERRLGREVRIQWFVYNAGPSAMEAILAKSIDLTYVGPNPAINSYSKSRGEEVRIIAGAANGGSALVVQGDSTMKTPADFRGKKIATPQLGNTQDVAARSWLVAGGLRITQMGGDAQVIPTANPDQLLIFKRKQLDGVWTVEPWVSLLETEAAGKALVEEPDAITTVLVARAAFLASQRDLARKFAAAHEELTDWIIQNPAEAQRLMAAELAAETRARVSEELIARAWKRIVPTHEISRDAMAKLVASAQAVGSSRCAGLGAVHP
jgi:NitT/TauT family transport system substrate-binding protein